MPAYSLAAYSCAWHGTRTALFLAAAALLAHPALAYLGNLACDRGITVGSPNIMGSAIAEGGSTNLKLAKGGTAIACGGNITAGDSLTFDLSGQGKHYLIEATAGAINGGICAGQRIFTAEDQPEALVLGTVNFAVPDSGEVVVRVAWSSEGGTVTVSRDCMYTVQTSASSSPEVNVS